ncbi:UDP-N-acetyl-D-galactosamine dehydrogenase [Virgibacillus halodenitrificans]|uniref:UDP-N-acetyl-D-galactosamine dehydrogenase n=1 Tax=Virgibacillus halodenitrificans TaxID=1482 RepID=A0AAC9J1D3_VIRHA|nr:nucleotide sugar dehydrogenase [Virgibacillus halodenitrificans]APC49621.1 UDP-N-acetyl-D-galactosamine dehydrogenase [Virgibacillus halodenitrificans]
MNLYENIVNKQEKVSVVGLGYVGMPIAVAFSQQIEVVGFDINQRKVESYLAGIDVTNEVGDEVLKKSKVHFTSNEKELRDCKFHIVAVPTPVSTDKTPDLSPIISACKTVGRNLEKGSVVVFESTVYPGVTEDICVPILEEESGLKCGVDFKVGYSPERINPGDKVNRLETITKVVSGMDEETLEIVAKVYELVIEAGVYRAESIKVAEASKVIENAQRDINIAFMNELSIVFNKMSIDTSAVLEAAGTKWNFLKFTPGLVGGHCIGVDPYYFIYKAEELGYHSQIIASGRRINDDMGKFIAENIVKKLIQANKLVKGSNVAIMGITFKENTPDSRNTKVIDIIKELEGYGINITVVDPIADEEEVWNHYGIKLKKMEDVINMDAVVFAVPHEEFSIMHLANIKKHYKQYENHNIVALNEVAATQESGLENILVASNELFENASEQLPYVLIDIKGIFSRKDAEKLGYLYWSL